MESRGRYEFAINQEHKKRTLLDVWSYWGAVRNGMKVQNGNTSAFNITHQLPVV
jgi:hypothetical protein